MGCCCLSDTTVHSSKNRSISNERAVDANKIATYKISTETHNIVHNESFSNISFETIPNIDEFSRIFEDFIGKLNRNYKLNKAKLIDFSNKWGALLVRIQKTLANPTKNKLNDLFKSRLLQVNRISKYKEKQAILQNSSNSIIEEKNEELEIDMKENSSNESSFNNKAKGSVFDKPADVVFVNKEKFIIFIHKAKFLENFAHIELPYIQIRIKEDQFQNNNERIAIFETKKADKKGLPEWNEFFCKEFDPAKKLDLNKAVFIVELLYFDSKSQLLNSLGENTFTFDEIRNQLVINKTIKYAKFDKIIAELFIKCQLIYDYQALLKQWEATVKVKKEIADRLIIKSHQNHPDSEEEKNNSDSASASNHSNNFRSISEDQQVFMEVNPNTLPESKKSKDHLDYNKENSILSMDEQSLAQSGYFDNQFYVKT